MLLFSGYGIWGWHFKEWPISAFSVCCLRFVVFCDLLAQPGLLMSHCIFKAPLTQS